MIKRESYSPHPRTVAPLTKTKEKRRYGLAEEKILSPFISILFSFPVPHLHPPFPYHLKLYFISLAPFAAHRNHNRDVFELNSIWFACALWLYKYTLYVVYRSVLRCNGKKFLPSKIAILWLVHQAGQNWLSPSVLSRSVVLFVQFSFSAFKSINSWLQVTVGSYFSDDFTVQWVSNRYSSSVVLHEVMGVLWLYSLCKGMWACVSNNDIWNKYVLCFCWIFHPSARCLTFIWETLKTGKE